VPRSSLPACGRVTDVPLIDLAIAVVVLEVTDLGESRVVRGVSIVTVALAGLDTIAVVVGMPYRTITVVVIVVCAVGLDCARVERRVLIVAVGTAQEAIEVTINLSEVIVVRISIAVIIDAVALLSGSREHSSVAVVAVSQPLVAIRVIIDLDTIRDAVAVGISEALEQIPVTVVVDGVAGLNCAWENLWIRIVTVAVRPGHVLVTVAAEHPVFVDVELVPEDQTVAVGVLTVTDLRGFGVDIGVAVVAIVALVEGVAISVRDAVIYQAIAVIVSVVADLGSLGVDPGVAVIAVLREIVAIPIQI